MVCIPKTNIELKTNTIYHSHTFGGFKCTRLVHNIVFWDMCQFWVSLSYSTHKLTHKLMVSFVRAVVPLSAL